MYHYAKPDNLVELLESAASRFSNNRLFGKINTDLEIDWTTYGEFKKRVDNLRGGLADQGINQDDFVGIISDNRQEWAVCAFATYGLGGRFVSMYEKELKKTWEYILRDSGIKVLFVANQELFEKVKGFLETIENLTAIFILDDSENNSMRALEERGKQEPIAPIFPTAQDIAALIYTSGTTGEPKGVLLSHGNLTSNAAGGYALFADNFKEESTGLSILPWAHSYGQVAELYNWLHFGGNLVFMRSVETLGEDLKIAAPSFLLAVPRVFNKIYSGIHKKMSESGGIAEKLFLMGLKAARRRRELEAENKSEFFTELKYLVAKKVVFAKILEKFGGRLTTALTASATMNVEVANFFIDIGISIYDAYGMTETSPAITMNSPSACKLGSVGRPIKDVVVSIDRTLTGTQSRDGEIIVHGPNVMQGYYNKPEATRAIMTADGGVHTGDRGYLDDDGFLFISGRIKEQYKLENGKYVFPAGIEEEIKLLPYIENVMVYGDGKPFNIGLLSLDLEALKEFVKLLDIKTSFGNIRNNTAILKVMAKEITGHLESKFAHYEIPKRYHIVAEPFSLENDLLTQTMKLKREKVLERYQEEINNLYNDLNTQEKLK